MVHHSVREHIELEEWESQIFDKLLATCEHHGLTTVLRCAGGWVRDKLLDRPSHDIDVALDNMTGSAFALKVNEYLSSQGLETRSIGVIAANPDQSKHLETATIRIDGVSIDLVNLRSETYTEQSRIPEMAMGTPLQDAERRDFTINSLFYNINQRAVEDFTGKGLRDLRDGVIRTPLEPETTFLDDPLRVLRAVRFASRYQFTMVEELVASARTEKVRQALERKVTRERVGVEVAGMVQGPHPLLAMEHLQTLGYFASVFQPPDALRERLGPDFGLPCLQVMKHGLELLAESRSLAPENAQPGDDEKRLVCLVTLLLPLRKLTVPLKKGKVQPLAQFVAREALKWRAKDGDQAVLLHQEMETLAGLYGDIRRCGDVVEAEHKVQLGNCLRRLRDLGPLAVELFPLLSLPQSVPLASDSPDRGADQITDGCTLEDMAARRRWMHDCIQSCGLLRCHEWSPLVNGAEIQAMVGMGKPGPLLGRLTTDAMDWQLLNPRVTRAQGDPVPEELVARLKETYARISQR